MTISHFLCNVKFSGNFLKKFLPYNITDDPVPGKVFFLQEPAPSAEHVTFFGRCSHRREPCGEWKYQICSEPVNSLTDFMP